MDLAATLYLLTKLPRWQIPASQVTVCWRRQQESDVLLLSPP